MKLITTKTREWRPGPYPCWEVFWKTTWYFLGIPYKSKKVQK